MCDILDNVFHKLALRSVLTFSFCCGVMLTTERVHLEIYRLVQILLLYLWLFIFLYLFWFILLWHSLTYTHSTNSHLDFNLYLTNVFLLFFSTSTTVVMKLLAIFRRTAAGLILFLFFSAMFMINIEVILTLLL